MTLRTGHAGDGLAVGAEAIVFCGPGRPLERIRVPSVVLRPGELLLAVELVTLGDDDVRMLGGELAVRGPVVPGRDVVGRVVAVAEVRAPRDVDGVRLVPGDRVAPAAVVGCARCRSCRAGLVEECPRARRYGRDRVERGWELSGGCATHLQVLARTRVHRLHGELVPAADEVFALADARAAFDRALAARGVRVGLRPDGSG